MIKSIREFNPNITIDNLKQAIEVLNIPIYISPANMNAINATIDLIKKNLKSLALVGTNLDKVQITATGINEIKKAIVSDLLSLSQLAFEAVDLDVEENE